jgi:lipopolysaccharide export system protein LptC
MRLPGRRLLVIAAGAALCVSFAVAQIPSLGEQKAWKFRLPEYDEQGRLKRQILGDQARMMASGDIEISNVRAEIYKDGRLDVCLSASNCVYVKKEETILSTADVRIENSQMVVTGCGLTWNANDQKGVILERVRVELKGLRGWVSKEMKNAK